MGIRTLRRMLSVSICIFYNSWGLGTLYSWCWRARAKYCSWQSRESDERGRCCCCCILPTYWIWWMTWGLSLLQQCVEVLTIIDKKKKQKMRDKSVIDQRDRLKTYQLRVRRSRFSRSLVIGAGPWTFWRRLICIKKRIYADNSRELSLALPLLKKEMSVRSSQTKYTERQPQNNTHIRHNCRQEWCCIYIGTHKARRTPSDDIT
jgi:hypothetical protein